MTDLERIPDGGYSVAVATFFVCPHCGVVDRQLERDRLDYACPSCKQSGIVTKLHFDTPVLELIDLMHSVFKRVGEIEARSTRGTETECVAVVVFFCTLGEVLLSQFLNELLQALGTQPSIAKRLLDDNLSPRARTRKLFPALVGDKWKSVLAELSSGSSFDFSDTFGFYLERVKERNFVVHEGNVWAVGDQVPRECLEQTWPLLNLFVELHNRYVVPALAKRGAKHWSAGP